MTLDDRVVSLVMCGSQARGDSDDNSDMDLCVVVDPCDFSTLLCLKCHVAVAMRCAEPDVSVFSTPVVETMARRGSLFLWHIRTEGRIITDRNGWFARALKTLTIYEGYAADIALYEAVLADCEAELYRQGPNEFDLHVLYTIARNLCIMLNMKAGIHCFGRVSAYETAKSRTSAFPLGDREFQCLVQYHLVYKRRAQCPQDRASRDRVVGITDQVKTLVQYVREQTQCLDT